MPEFDFPAHSHALLKALPELAEPEDRSKYISIQEYSDNTLNPGLSSTWEFLENIIKEIAEVFDYEYVHLGFDEIPKDVWANSPACKILKEEEGICTNNELRSYFANRLIDILNKNGKKPAFWEEASSGKLKENSLLISWQSEEVTLKIAEKNHKVIASPAQYCYLDIRQKKSFLTPGAHWVDNLSLEKSYSFSPAKHKNIIGIQAALWGEMMYEKSRVREMLFPRLIALAEVAWCNNERKNFELFKKNLTLISGEINS